jgi:hypothetical protein
MKKKKRRMGRRRRKGRRNGRQKRKKRTLDAGKEGEIDVQGMEGKTRVEKSQFGRRKSEEEGEGGKKGSEKSPMAVYGAGEYRRRRRRKR